MNRENSSALGNKKKKAGKRKRLNGIPGAGATWYPKLCVFFTLNPSFYSSTSSTPSVRADSSSQRYESSLVTELRHRQLSTCVRDRDRDRLRKDRSSPRLSGSKIEKVRRRSRSLIEIVKIAISISIFDLFLPARIT